MLDCKRCSHYPTCRKPCVYVENLINGRTRLRESCRREISQYIPQSDYNEILYATMRTIEATDLERLEAVRNIATPEKADLRRKAFYGLLLCGLSQRQIGRLMRINQSRVSRIMRPKSSLIARHKSIDG